MQKDVPEAEGQESSREGDVTAAGGVAEALRKAWGLSEVFGNAPHLGVMREGILDNRKKVTK